MTGSRGGAGLVPGEFRLIRAHALKIEGLFDIERRLTAAFMTRAHIHLPASLASTPHDDAITAWMVMQHYGAPTRLVDWTASPYVAAYFAVRDLSRTADTGAVWHFNTFCMHQGAGKKWGKDSQEGVRAIQLPRAMDRMSSQLARFTFASTPIADHWPLITEAHAASELLPNQCGRILIKGDLKAKFLRQLYSANVQAAALFPGLDGIGQLIQDSLHLSSRAVEFGGTL